MPLSSNIQRIRKLKKVSVQELADQIGVNKQSIYDWENAAYAPSKDNLDKLAKALGVEVKVFFDDNITLVHERSDNTEKHTLQIFKELFEAETEYRVVPKSILEGKYVIILESQIGKTEEALWVALKTKDDHIQDLKDEIAFYRSTRTPAQKGK